MPPRIQEICELLRAGTENGTLKWTAFRTTGGFSTTLKNATFVIAVECHDDGEPFFWSLRILTLGGDEIDSWGADNDSDDAEELSKLWKGARAQHERTLTATLRPITDVLRASVLGTSAAS